MSNPADFNNAFDANSTRVSDELECDVVIVGSGAGGGVSAEILSRSGLKVILLEEGPLKTSDDFNMDEKTAYADLYQEVAGRQTLDKSIQILQGKAVGGSTTVNWTASFRTPDKTLNHWADQYHIKGMQPEDLKPWFEWAENRLNIHPWGIPANANNQLLANGLEKLGWQPKVIPRNVKGCANLGYCGMGCPLDAKQSMLVTCVPTALANGASLIYRARVDELLVSGSQVKGVLFSAMDSFGQRAGLKSKKIIAKRVILAAGAIGTPAILLRSGLSRINPNIGRRTFLHPVTASVAEMADKVDAFYGAPQSVYSDHFLWRDGITGKPGYKIEVPPMHPVLAASLLRQHGELHRRLMSRLAYYQASIALVRDGFHPQTTGGRVMLDSYGFPKLDYSPNEPLWEASRHAMLSMAEIQFAAGAKTVMPLHMDASPVPSLAKARKMIADLDAKPMRWQLMSAHVMGGCAMGEGSEQAICDSNGDFRFLDNLNVIDGSLFPTSLGVNPQLSIYAIAAKLSSQIVSLFSKALPEDIANVVN